MKKIFLFALIAVLFIGVTAISASPPESPPTVSETTNVLVMTESNSTFITMSSLEPGATIDPTNFTITHVSATVVDHNMHMYIGKPNLMETIDVGMTRNGGAAYSRDERTASVQLALASVTDVQFLRV